MRFHQAVFVFVALLAGCDSAPQFVYLTRPGISTPEEVSNYYAAMKDHLPEKTLGEWFKPRCFTDDAVAYYYNPTDLGLGREMRCAKCTSGPNDGLVSCAVSNHGVPQGLDVVNSFKKSGLAPTGELVDQAYRKSIVDALKATEKYADPKQTGPKFRGATVAMDWKADREDHVRFYIYDGENPDLAKLTPPNQVASGLIPGLQLDSEGIKFIRNCLTCHGGKYDTKSNRILGASFLDFDIAALTFGDDPIVSQTDPGFMTTFTKRDSNNLQKLKTFNALVFNTQPAKAIADRIDGSYPGGGVNAPATAYQGGYVPAGWAPQANLYKTIVHKYCGTCHFSQAATYNLQEDPSLPITFNTSSQWLEPKVQDLIRQGVCGSSDMPHAEVTRNNMKRDAAAFAQICSPAAH